ncbi:MAG: beta strand repeat-containing protein, partial [Planctomycetota bacterium]
MTLSQLKSILRRLFQPGKASATSSLRKLKMLRLEERRVFNASVALTGVQLLDGENLTISSGGQQDLGSGTSVDTVRLEVTEGTWTIDPSITENQYDLLTGDKVLLLDAQVFLTNTTTNNSLPIQGSTAQTDNVTINVADLTLPAHGIFFTGGEDPSSTDHDRLTIEGYAIDQDDDVGTADLLVVHEGPEKGRVELAGFGTIRFDEIEPLSLKGTAADVRIELPAGADTNVVLSDDGIADNDFSRIDGDSFELTDFRNPTSSLTVSDTTGVRQIFVRGLDSGFHADLQITDADFDNTVTFEQQELVTGGGSLTVEGNDIRFLTSVRTVGGDIGLQADTEIFSTSSADLNTSGTQGSGLAGGDLTVSLDASGTASFLGRLITAGADSAAADGGNGGDVSFTANNGNITVSGITTSGGTDLAGSRTGGSAGDIFVQAAGNTISLNGDFLALGGTGQTLGSGGNITIDGAAKLAADISLSTGSSTGNIQFTDKIDAIQAGQQSLTLNSGTGNITLLAAAGQGTALGAFTIQSATDVTLQSVIAASLTQTAGTGLTTLAGPVTTTDAPGVDLKGKDLRIEKLITTQNGGSVRLDHGGATVITPLGDISASGDVLISASLGISTAGDITSIGGSITLDGHMFLTGPVAVRTASLSGGDIRLLSPVDLAGHVLRLDAGNAGSITAERAITGNGIVIVERGRNLTFDVLDLRQLNILRVNETTIFTAAVTVSENRPAAPTSALVIRSFGDIFFQGPVTATAVGGLNIDVAGVDITVNGNVQATGSIMISAKGDLSIAGVAITADSDSDVDGGLLRLRGNSDVQDGGFLQAAAGSVLSGAQVDLAGALVVVETITATAGDVMVFSGSAADLRNHVTAAAGSVVVRADNSIGIHGNVTAALDAELQADVDLDGTGFIHQTTGTITAASGIFSAAEGIYGDGSPGLPAGLTVSLSSLSAVNREPGDIRIVQTAAGGTLTAGLVRNVSGLVYLRVVDGSLLDGNGADANIEAAFADIGVFGGSLGTAAGDVFRGSFDAIEVDVAGALTISAPDGFAVVSGHIGGPVSLTASSAWLESAGDLDLTASSPVITSNLAILSGGHVRLPDSGLAVTGDLRLEAQSVSSQTSGNPVLLGITSARTDRLLLNVASAASIDFQIEADRVDVSAQSDLQLTLHGPTVFADLNCDLTSLSNPGYLTILQSVGSTVTQGTNRGTTPGDSMNDRLISGGLLLIGSSSFEFDHPDNDVDVLAAEVGGVLTFRDANAIQIDILSGGPSGLSAAGVSTQDQQLLLTTETGPLELLQAVSAGTAKAGITAGGDLTQSSAGRIVAAEAILRAGGSIGLGSSGNDIGRIALSSGQNAELRLANGLTAGSVSLTSGSLSGATAGGFIDLRALAGDILLEEAVSAGGGVLLDASDTVGQQALANVQSVGLAVRAGLTVDLRAAGNSVGQFAANAGGSLRFDHAGALAISAVTVNGVTVTGLNTTDADASIRTLSGGISLNSILSLGTGNLGLTSADFVQQDAAGDIFANGLAVNATGTMLLQNSGNLISKLAIVGSDSASIRNGQSMDVTAVSVNGELTTGILLSSGNLTLETAAGNLQISENVLLAAASSVATLVAAEHVDLNASVTAPASLVIVADADHNNTGTIRGNGLLESSVGRLEAAEGIGSNGSIQIRMNLVSALNTGSGDVRISEITAGGDLTIADIVNVSGIVDIHVAAGSLLDGNADSLNITARDVVLTASGGNIGSPWAPFFLQQPDSIEVDVAQTLHSFAPGHSSAISGLIGGEITGEATSFYVRSTENLIFRNEAPSIANLALLADSDRSGNGDLHLGNSLTVTDNLFLTGEQILAADSSIDLAARRLLVRAGSDVSLNVALNETAAGQPGVLDAAADGNLTIELSTTAVLADLDGNNTALLTTTATGSIVVNAVGNTLIVADDVISNFDSQSATGSGQISLSANTLRLQDAVISEHGDIELRGLSAVIFADTVSPADDFNLDGTQDNDNLLVVSTLLGNIDVLSGSFAATGATAGQIQMADTARLIAGRTDSTIDPGSNGNNNFSAINPGTQTASAGFASIHLAADLDISISGLFSVSEGVDAIVVQSSDGSILATADPGIAAVTLLSDNATAQLLSRINIGTTAAPIALHVARILAAATTGSVSLNETNGLLAVNLQATAGHVTLTLSEGNLEDSDADLDVIATTATIQLNGTNTAIGSQTNALQTSVSSLNVQNSGNQFLTELDDLTQVNLNAASGT